MKPQASERLLGLLLALALLGLGAALIAGWGWYRAARDGGLDRLAPEERQRLAEELLESSPGVFEAAWYAPEIGYTLRRKAEITAWDDTFTSNELGLRSAPPAKQPGTFRVVFVGDSWTYGMGVRQRESFPEVAAELARRHAGLERRVEALTLALPGWNTLNELEALWFFYPQLAPDAVVFCPTSNDNHSLAGLLPNGSLTTLGVPRDRFGAPHAVVYPLRHLDAYGFRQRWHTVAMALRDTEARLADLGVPTLIFFVSRWRPAAAHALVGEVGLSSPYVINPRQLTLGDWLNPPPALHGNAAAHRLYGRTVYRALAEVLGWAPLPGPPLPHEVETPLFHGPPPGVDWQARADERARFETRREIPERFRPSARAAVQCAGPIDPETGLMGRATTVLVRRGAGVDRLAVTIRRLEAPGLYPLELELSIASPSGGSRRRVTVPATGGDRQTFELEVPPDLPEGSALEVQLVASHTVRAPDLPAPRSLYLEAIEAVE